MEDIKLTVTQEQIQKAMEAAMVKALSDSYDSPVRKAVEESIKNADGLIKKAVNEIIGAAISDPEFKSRIADVVLTQMVASALKK